MRFPRLCAVKRDFRPVSTRSTILYLAFAAILSSTCYFCPVPDDFDRYIYEALVRGRYQSVETIYPIIMHETPRAENSSVLDSPTHLRQLEPLYAIRPTYVDAIAMFSRVGIPIQRSINSVSALSFFGIAILPLAFTGRPFYSALLLATPAVLVIGRLGTPDALSTLLLITAFWVLTRERFQAGVSLMILSVWVRTDNVLLVIAALGWLVWKRKLSPLQGSVFTPAALGSVLFINHMAGTYGWTVLFRYSFYLEGNILLKYRLTDSGICTSFHHRFAVVCPSAGALDFAWGRGLALAIALSGTLARRRRNSVGALHALSIPRRTLLGLGVLDHGDRIYRRRELSC
jgi:hypothetical protein